MDQHLLALFDLLGFSNLMQQHDPADEEAALMLLTSLAKIRGDFKREETATGPNTTNVSVQPAISSFSDHIVYSYPLAAVKETPSIYFFQSLANSAAAIAYDAMQLGCLVRGAIAIGPLHHADGVVFGHALIDAHKIESELAIYPRIVVADSAAEMMGISTGTQPLLIRDYDGLWYLDYMGEAFDHAARRGSGISSNMQWIATVRQTCDAQIEKLSRENNPRGLRHWRWFRSSFDRSISRKHHSLTGESPKT